MQRLEAPTPYLQKMAAAAACVGCLEGCDGVLGLLGVCASGDELLLQGAVLQEEEQELAEGQNVVQMVGACTQPRTVHSMDLPGWLCAGDRLLWLAGSLTADLP